MRLQVNTAEDTVAEDIPIEDIPTEENTFQKEKTRLCLH